MITVKCKLNDEKYYELADETFNNAHMKKINIGEYLGDENTFNSSFLAIRSLLMNKEFVKTIISFTRDSGGLDGQEDLIDYY